MAKSVTVTIETELVERYRAARKARREAGERLAAEDNAETFGAFNAAQRVEDEAAAWLALAVDNNAPEAPET